MIHYYFNRKTPEKSVAIVDLTDVSDIENMVTDIYDMIDVVINHVAERYIEEEWQQSFVDELKELLADMLYDRDIK